MRRTSICSLSLFFYLYITSVALGQSYSLEGRSSLDLNLGLWHESRAANELTLPGVRSSAKSNGFIGGIAFSHWLKENLAMTVEFGVLFGEASSTVNISGVSQRSSSVVPLLLGIKYYVPEPEMKSSVRPFLSLAAGPYMGFEAENTVLVQENRSETALGMRLGGGIDFLLSRHWKLGVDLGYNLMADYSTPIGARKNYNGPDFSLGFGFVFGRGSE